jgi:hypothetical protein
MKKPRVIAASEPMVDIGKDNVRIFVPLKEYLRVTQHALAFKREWVGSGKGDNGTDYRETFVENIATNMPALQIVRRDMLMAQAVASKITKEA